MLKKTIYIPEDICKRIQKDAQEERRSFASQVLYVLERHYSRYTVPPSPYYLEGGVSMKRDPGLAQWFEPAIPPPPPSFLGVGDPYPDDGDGKFSIKISNFKEILDL